MFVSRGTGETVGKSGLKTVEPYHPHEWCFSVHSGHADGSAVVGILQPCCVFWKRHLKTAIDSKYAGIFNAKYAKTHVLPIL